jgi:16S rRNA (cytidine1402-2'-O)-methyltransferase
MINYTTNQNSKAAVKPGVMYITATPIGNLKDITIRALEVLQNVDFIICEDSRKTSILLQHYGIKAKLYVYNDHSGQLQRDNFLQFIKAGKSAALVSDAGMPLVADPGHKLVLAAIDEAIEINIVPGPSAVLSALALSGLPSERFIFYGFMPEKEVARVKAITELSKLAYSSIFFESARRLSACLAAIDKIMPKRNVAIAREMTKIHEEVYRGTVTEALKWCLEHKNMKGEVVVILAGEVESGYNEEQINHLISTMLGSHSVKDLAKIISTATGLSKKRAYELCLRMQTLQ